MSEPFPRVSAVEESSRIASLDVLRGVAVLGILLMNIPLMGLSWSLPVPPIPSTATPDWIAFLLQDVLAAGTMRGLFTLLFGAGAIIMLTRASPEATSQARTAYFTRCMMLMLLGFCQFAVFLWPGEILFCYGLVGLVLPCFVAAPKRLLLTAAAVAILLFSIDFHTHGMEKVETVQLAQAATAATAAGHEPSEEQQAARKKLDQMIAKLREAQSPAAIDKERAQRTHFPQVLEWSTQAWKDMNFSAEYQAWFYIETLGFMLLGMFLYRSGVLTGQSPTRVYGWMASLGLLLGVVIRGGIDVARWRHGFLPDDVTSLELRYSLYQAGRLAMTLGIVGALMLLLRSGLLRALTPALMAVGRMALSNYIGQSMITSLLFYGFGLWGRFGFAQLMGICVLIWIFQAYASLLWLRRYRMGPAESLLRAVTYGEPLRLQKRTSLGQPAPELS